MAVVGQRFELNLDDEEADDDQLSSSHEFTAPPPLSLNFVKDVVECESTDVPLPPQMTSSATTGFPEHKKRSRPSRFKQKHGNPAGTVQNGARLAGQAALDAPKSWDERDRIQADVDSQRALDEMSRDEIEEQRRELLSGMVPGVTPSLIERLLQRANVNEHATRDPLLPPPEPTEEEEGHNITAHVEIGGSKGQTTLTSPEPKKFVTFASPPPPHNPQPTINANNSNTEAAYDTFPSSHSADSAPLHPPPDLRPATSSSPSSFPRPAPPKGPHFPTTAPPDLDPTSPTFLAELQKHYFPHLSPDPSRLSWMQPLPSAPSESAYNPASASLAPSELRFDFRGSLLPPALAHQIPVSAGLHHHGSAPEAAGYTVPELARLCRSASAPQRCVAYQTLGRVLYRLGTGVFGPEGGDLYEGLWRCVNEGKVLQVMMAEANGPAGRGAGGSRSAWACATEALWNWRMGGGKKEFAG